MARFDLEHEVQDESVLRRTAQHLRSAGILLPTFSQLASPKTIPSRVQDSLADVDPDAPHPLNLFRVHWNNSAERRSQVEVPEFLLLEEPLTGVPAPIVLALGNRFPLIRAHKVLAAYACLIPRLVTGRFDPTQDRALWPSTGNYCRGGVAISRILGCRGVAILPQGMSQERFRWLEEWVVAPEDIVRTPGSESNVKEIYDRCDELGEDPHHVVLNQFSEFCNHLVHYLCTGKALERIFVALQERDSRLRLAAFVSATGSAGTIGAGDYLKEQYNAKIVAVEPVECPTMLYNGFGAHNIQGIGDKHIPLIHNVTNTDVVAAISDRHTDALSVLFASEAGRAYLGQERQVPAHVIAGLSNLGLSSICNLLAAIKVARRLRLGKHDVILTVATDGAELYASERRRILAHSYADGFHEPQAEKVFAEAILELEDEHWLELTPSDRDRIFNLGYFTWVEQRGISPEDFSVRREQKFWRELRDFLPLWDHAIEELNSRAQAAELG